MFRYTTFESDPESNTRTNTERGKRVVRWSMPYSTRGHAVRRVPDLGLGIAGAGIALASAAFALVMMKADITDPSFSGSEYLLLFTRPLHAPGMPAPQIASRFPASNIDYTVTGSIGPRQADKIVDPQTNPQAPLEPLKGYVLRSVRGGIATIYGPTGRFIVETGSLLPNGDEVRSIDRRAGHWVVVTSTGIIEDQ
jgi:hypothetical protein